MTLSDYLKQPGKSATDLANEVKVAVSTITRAARGEVVPSRKLMHDLFEATGGQVTPNDFFGIAA
jgi:ribosome-binding protein aMBF1 (putative translation factor)